MPGNILARRNLETLACFAASNVLLAFDYDGTLAPIVSDPAVARMRPETRQSLTRVARRYPCIVVSGRPLEDLEKRLKRVPVWYLFGNHGFEPHAGNAEHAARVREWANQLSRELPEQPGLVIEQKKYSLAVHYRHVRDKARVIEAIGHAVRQLPDVRTIQGAEAFNLLPRGAADKGMAVQQARRMFGCDTVIYVGDDGTDEDAFTSASVDRLLSIRVGSGNNTRARFNLRTQRDVDELLKHLLTFRPAR